MDNPGPRRYHAESLVSAAPPLHELVALAVARKFKLHVEIERVGAAVMVDGNRVIDHQVDRHQRFDAFRVAAKIGGHVAHRGKIGQQRNAGEILEHHTRHHERNFRAARCFGLPFGQLANMVGGDALAIGIAQDRFKDNTQ